jgi:hypothetical protein
MSAASVATPLLTSYIQSPSRFTPGVQREVRGPQTNNFSVGNSGRPAPASYYRSKSQFGVNEIEGRVPVVIDPAPNPLHLNHLQNPYEAQLRAISPESYYQQTIRQQNEQPNTAVAPTLRAAPGSNKRGPRMNNSTRTSAGFTLAKTAKQEAEIAARKAAERERFVEEQTELFERAREKAEEEERLRAEEKQRSDAIFYQTGFTQTPQRFNASGSSTSILSGIPSSPSASQQDRAAQKAQQLARHKREARDHKIAYRDREIPPTPDHAEDQMTAKASEHTGIYPGPLNRAPVYQGGLIEFDTEPIAPEGTKERTAQKLRTNPLLDPNFHGQSDAAGLGYGVRHKDHFRYLSPWTTKDPALMFEFAKQTKPIDTGYRSKLAHLGIGYREEVKGIGLGHEHPMWNQAVSVRRPEEILRDYGGDRKQVEKWFNVKSGQVARLV